MGVDISKLVNGRAISLGDISGKAVAIDAFNTLYQFLTTIRQANGTPLKDRDGRVTSHLSGLLYRSVALLEIGVKPAFVFDGRPPKLKTRTLETRRVARESAQKDWQEALEAGDMKRALTKASQTSRLDKEMIDEAKSLLGSMGIPWIVSPTEGEAQMAHMARKGDVWAGASQDFDAVLFGTPLLVRNLTLSTKRKTSSGKSVDITPELVELEVILRTLSVTREQLVDLSILVGTDFNEGVHGIGPKKALKLIQEHADLETILERTDIIVPSEFEEVRGIFLQPEVEENYELAWNTVDQEGVRRLMCDKHGFSVDRIDSTLSRVGNSRVAGAQSSLDVFGR
jgi:flap endonuclease-1